MKKTKKGVTKRFKLTGSGKLMRSKPGFGHLLRRKSTKNRRAAGQDQSVSDAFTKKNKACML